MPGPISDSYTARVKGKRDRGGGLVTDLLALDIASVCGWARGPVGPDGPQCGSVRFGKPGASQLAICGRAMEWAIDTIKPPLPDVVAIEDLLPPHVTRGKSNVDHDLLAHLHGIIMGVCFMRGVFKVYKYQVQSIRNHFIDLKTCARGEQKMMVQRKCKSLGWVPEGPADDDAADACACWSYACGLIDPEQAIRISPLFNRVRAIA
jgi:Holliday junction resolvasome RuvABC endonuclease subunit